MVPPSINAAHTMVSTISVGQGNKRENMMGIMIIIREPSK